ncbi:unnamed protein product, partial [Mesorhabditis belari]|uniref:7TM GPCR serpentine receptor class x (Srx) domain-containing protein n=1 Tax=Mesorhabditis belari TaxID=2138241 RepID=A0AAF3ESQ1_9BILA
MCASFDDCHRSRSPLLPTSLNVPIIDNIFGFAAFISDSFVYISKILLAVNRFFAIAFGGNFFIYIEKAYLVQYLILFGYPMLVSWPMFFSGYRVTWANWNNYYSMENGLFSELYLQATQVYAGYVVIGVCTVLDSLTYSLIRQRRRKYHTTRMSVEQLRLRKDHILITQMLCNNLTVILEIGAVTVILALAQPSNMLLFMCWTVSWMIASGVEGLLFVIFFREHHPCRTKSPVLFLSTA